MADSFKEAVCVHAGRVYDSCCDRDCLEDLAIYFSPAGQQLVNQAIGVRGRSAELLTTLVDVEPVTFNRGYFSVDMLFYFLVTVDVFTADCTAPTPVRGVCSFNKKVILFGGEGSAKVFCSGVGPLQSEAHLPLGSNLPTAYVQTVDPVLLSATLTQVCGCDPAKTKNAPAAVLAVVGGSFAPPETVQRRVTGTLGLFSVVQLVRSVQMLMPVYDYCVPDKACVATTDDPCDVFNRLQFPMEEFFPPHEPAEPAAPSPCDE